MLWRSLSFDGLARSLSRVDASALETRGGEFPRCGGVAERGEGGAVGRWGMVEREGARRREGEGDETTLRSRVGEERIVGGRIHGWCQCGVGWRDREGGGRGCEARREGGGGGGGALFAIKKLQVCANERNDSWDGGPARGSAGHVKKADVKQGRAGGVKGLAGDCAS